MSEVKRVKITLNKEARAEAIEMRQLRGIATDDTFEGPDFEETTGIEADSGFVFVELADGTVYGYPMSGIARIAQYTV